MSSAPEISGTVLNFVFGPSRVCCRITTERSERNAVVQISAQMKFGQEDSVSCANPTWNSTESVGQLSLKNPAVPMNSAPLAQPVSLIALAPDDAWSLASRVGGAQVRPESASFSLPALNPASVPLRKVGPFRGAGTAELVSHLFFGRRAGLEVDGDRSRQGGRCQKQKEEDGQRPGGRPDRRTRHALKIGTGGPCVSTAGVPIRSPWTLGLVHSASGAPSRSATRSTPARSRRK